MAKKSWIARDKKKAETVKRYAELRAQLKAEKDYIGLTMLPDPYGQPLPCFRPPPCIYPPFQAFPYFLP